MTTQQDDLDDEKLARGLEAFAYAVGVGPDRFARAIRRTFGIVAPLPPPLPPLRAVNGDVLPPDPDVKLHWFDAKANDYRVVRARIRFVGETWHWEVFLKDGSAAGGTCGAFRTAYARILDNLGVEVLELTACPPK